MRQQCLRIWKLFVLFYNQFLKDYASSEIFFPVRYDGETFVKEVDVNYVLWEQHGRAGYKYSKTMKEVSGCCVF